MFMIPATFTSSILAGVVFSQLKSKIRYLFFAGIILVALFTNRNHLRVNMYIYPPFDGLIASEITTNSFHEYLPKAADSQLLTKTVLDIYPETIIVKDAQRSTKSFTLNTFSSTDNLAALRQFSFPGLNLYIDGKKTNFIADEQGRVTFPLPTGDHQINLRFEDTSLIKASKLITVLSILGLFILIIKIHVNKKT